MDLENIILSKVSLAQKTKKIICSPSYADIRSRVNSTKGLNFEHMIKREHTREVMRIGKTPKKLHSICCPQCRETNAGTLKQQRPIGEGDQELEKSLVREKLL
jgi:hypothetical protein